MKLGFYYHIPAFEDNLGKILMPSYLGVFIDSLAPYFEEVILFMHEEGERNRQFADYTMTSSNLSFVSLGQKTPAWHRHLFHKSILKKTLSQLTDIDVLLVRSPSPLAPFFHKYLPSSVKLIYFIVGSYKEGAKFMEGRGLKQTIIKQYLKLNIRRFEQVLKNAHILVNSPKLLETYQYLGKSINLIKTTTLSTKDFYEREDVLTSSPAKLIYTGRIDLAKGLMELVEAVYLLKQDYPDLELHIVGWEDDASRPVESQLRKKASSLSLKIDQDIYFHGKKKIGEELNAMYRMADIFIIPSYHEGFPRVIWEAMAQGLPVIATSVGAIPQYLENQTTALIIEPKKVEAIINAVKLLINDSALRQRLIHNGFVLSKENTLESQAQKLINILYKLK